MSNVKGDSVKQYWQLFRQCNLTDFGVLNSLVNNSTESGSNTIGLGSTKSTMCFSMKKNN